MAKFQQYNLEKRERRGKIAGDYKRKTTINGIRYHNSLNRYIEEVNLMIAIQKSLHNLISSLGYEKFSLWA
jgi:hypothetical protein